jgi:hypothetical protein
MGKVKGWHCGLDNTVGTLIAHTPLGGGPPDNNYIYTVVNRNG